MSLYLYYKWLAGAKGKDALKKEIVKSLRPAEIKAILDVADMQYGREYADELERLMKI